MMVPDMQPPPYLGSGEVHDRTVRLEPYPKQPWYYDNTKTMFAAIVAIVVIVSIGGLMG